VAVGGAGAGPGWLFEALPDVDLEALMDRLEVVVMDMDLEALAVVDMLIEAELLRVTDRLPVLETLGDGLAACDLDPDLDLDTGWLSERDREALLDADKGDADRD